MILKEKKTLVLKDSFNFLMDTLAKVSQNNFLILFLQNILSIFFASSFLSLQITYFFLSNSIFFFGDKSGEGKFDKLKRLKGELCYCWSRLSIHRWVY